MSDSDVEDVTSYERGKYENQPGKSLKTAFDVYSDEEYEDEDELQERSEMNDLFNRYINFIRKALIGYYEEIGLNNRISENADKFEMFRIFLLLDHETKGKFSEDPIKYIESQIEIRVILNIFHEITYWEQIWNDTDFKRFFHQQYKNWYFDKFTQQHQSPSDENFKKQLEGYWKWRENKCRKIGNSVSCGLFFKGGKRTKRRTKRRKKRTKRKKRNKRKKRTKRRTKRKKS